MSRKRPPEKNVAKNWSAFVTAKSNALDLEQGVFSQKDPLAIAQSLKRSAETSTRRKSSPLKSAMSMICFYQNRAGKKLSEEQRKIIDQSKDALRQLFGRQKKD